MSSEMYVNAYNSQFIIDDWMDALSENMGNLYTPGYRETKMTFRDYLNNFNPDIKMKNIGQGKAIPGADENVFLEGSGFFVLKNDEGRTIYTRLGDFKYSADGTYESSDGFKVQGYILNDKGEIMTGTKYQNDNSLDDSLANGGTMNIPTTEIKLWKDPDNGKFLGKYDEIKIKEDGVFYGLANNGKVVTPLYKIALADFHNSQQLMEFKSGRFLETAYSGKPVAGRGEIKSGLIELSNIDFKANATYWTMAKNQQTISSALVKNYRDQIEQIAKSILGE